MTSPGVDGRGTTWSGLTWDHPRGRNALEAARRAGGPIEWSVQPLEGFESASIADVCARHDVVVLDHPHLGEALAADCLLALDDVFEAGALADMETRAIGRSFVSYRMEGRQWALPLDAATQVMAVRADLVDGAPRTWGDVAAMAGGGGVALSVAGVHALLTFLSIIASLDPELDLADGGWPDDGLATEAVARMASVDAHAPPATRTLNPIGLLERMASADDVRLVPLVYGYVNYADTSRPRPIAFRDAPTAGARPGSILGGTGMAISARCAPDDALIDHLGWLMSAEAQRSFIPAHQGQPSAEAAWTDPDVNAPVGGFYRATAATLRHAAIRPRHDGYIDFQGRASEHLRAALRAERDPAAVAREIRGLFEASLPSSQTVNRP